MGKISNKNGGANREILGYMLLYRQKDKGN